MSSQSSVEKGDEFTECVISLLASAGFKDVSGERRDDFKKTDASAIYLNSSFDGVLRYRFEMKNYEGNVHKSDCVEFVTEYETLIEKDMIDRAWLISKNNISPDGRALIDAKKRKGLNCFTLKELNRTLMDFGPYLTDIIDEYEKSALEKFYISPQTDKNESLEKIVREWMCGDNGVSPLAIIGSYGQGKSTFAKHLAATLAKEALQDQSCRVPILITLGDLVEEQRLDGLIGSVLASKYNSQGYHYRLFKELNKAGALLIIYDGLDEMKHGMMPRIFQRNLENLLELDEGNSRILLLGRDSVAYSDEEFRSIIHGYQTTKSGQLVRSINRKNVTRVNLRGFTVDEAKTFMTNYFRAIASDEGLDVDWIEKRIVELKDKKFEDLSMRPVHAQMLCKIATDSEQNLSNLSLFDLYDRFIHHLIDREASKAGRYSGFDLEVRRDFNSAFAWWLWEQSQSTTATISDIPDEICKDVVQGIDHDFSADALRRELAQGCLVHKAESTVYFGHRSIQEFLVAEHLFHTDLLYNSETLSPDVGRVYSYVSEVIIEFIVNWLERSSKSKEIVQSWLKAFESWQPKMVNLDNVGFIIGLVRFSKNVGGISLDQFNSSAWGLIVDAIENGAGLLDKPNATVLQKLRGNVQRSKNFKFQCSSLQVISHIYRNSGDKNALMFLLDAMINPAEIKEVSDTLSNNHGQDIILNRSKYPLLWIFMKSVRVEKVFKGESRLILKFEKMDELIRAETGLGLSYLSTESSINSIGFQELYQQLAKSKVSNFDIEIVRKFLNTPGDRRRIKPIEVEVLVDPMKKNRRGRLVAVKRD